MTDRSPPALEGSLIAPKDARFALVAARFNETVVSRLVDGAQSGLSRLGVPPENVTVVRVPGAFELPAVTSRLAKSQKFDAIIALGAVIRGATAHFDHVAAQVSSGLAAIGPETGVPVVFGVLTTDTTEQAEDRAGGKLGNRGFDAALAAVELVTLGRALGEHGL